MEYYFSLEDLKNSIADLYKKEIEIPDLLVNPYTISQIALQNQQYYFQFTWNIRQQRCYLSIFKITNGERDFYIKNRMLINNIELSKYIHKTDWEGFLRFESVSNNYDEDYMISDISEKFVLRYYASKSNE